jgi:prolyl-tRNA editing enzyme YbaK/EbsC (Cys-tRNA(Pro) deacylase)
MFVSHPTTDAQQRTLRAIRDLLASREIAFREVHHQATYTSEQSAAARGEDIAIGGKAMVIKLDQAFRLFVLSAARSVDSGAIRKRLNARRSRFATPEELLQLTGLEPGCVPPFGRPVLELDLYADEALLRNDRIAFNAGSLTDSIIMSMRDYLAVAQPAVFPFSKDR